MLKRLDPGPTTFPCKRHNTNRMKMQQTRPPVLWILFVVVQSVTLGAEPGLVHAKPSKGRFVAVESGYMVAYQQRIPGSNASIEMLPVPAGTITLQPLPKSNEGVRESAPLVDASATEPKANDELTVHAEPFWISRFEITMQQFLPYRSLYYKQKKAARADPKDVPKLGDVDAVTGPTEEQAAIFWEPDTETLAEEVEYRLESGRGSIGRVQQYEP